MEIDGLPVRVVSRIERTTVDVELVAEDELPLLAGDEVRISVLRLWCIGVDKTPVARHRGNLAGCIDPTQIETAESRLRCAGEVGDQGIARTVESNSALGYKRVIETAFSQESKHPHAEDEQATKVRKTSRGEDMSSLIALVVSPGIGVVEVVVALLVVHRQVCAPRGRVGGEGILGKLVTNRRHRASYSTYLVREGGGHGIMPAGTNIARITLRRCERKT